MTDRAMTGETSTFAVVTGGGTAGHVLPALAVAEALVDAGRSPDEILYVGCQRGIETQMLPRTPFRSTMYDVVGFQRSLSRRNIGFLPKMIRSTRRAVRDFRRDRPAVVVSVGGYASMPAVFAARRLRIPVVVVSYDRTPGRASRLAAKRAVACAVAFEGSPLPRAVVTGAPVRQEILHVDRVGGRSDARRKLGVPDDRFLVAVMGGSLGSRVLNSAIGDYVAQHRGDGGLAVRHAAGERFVAEVRAARPDDRTETGRDQGQTDGGTEQVLHQVDGYEADMASVYAAADVFIGRGGASTVHEVAVTGVPAILVPWANAADDHQTDNVAWLAENGAAVLLAESDLGRLGEEIDRLRHDDVGRSALGAAAAACGAVHRSGALADLIERVALTSAAS
jgi:UDP-N-acetylglucosamine:LPS N-acetylglucosamine transferase